MIEVKDLSKDYLLKKKAPGLKGAITGLVKNNYETLHAVQDLNFSIDEGNDFYLIRTFSFFVQELSFLFCIITVFIRI